MNIKTLNELKSEEGYTYSDLTKKWVAVENIIKYLDKQHENYHNADGLIGKNKNYVYGDSEFYSAVDVIDKFIRIIKEQLEDKK